MPTESMKYALQPVIRALITKQLLRHPDLEVNISVARCICEVFTIMVRKTPYDDEQMKDFFELVVITFEKLSSESGGCFDKMIKVLRTLDSCKLSVKMCNLQLDGLIVRLFEQFLTFADSNSPDVVIKMKNIMTMLIDKSEMLNCELVDLLVTSVRKENKIASPVCWQLGGEVLKNCVAHLKPHLDGKVVKEVYSSLTKTIPSTTDTSKLRKDSTTHKRKMAQSVRPCQDAKKHGKKTPLFDDPSMPTKSVTEEKAENLVGRRIKVWWSKDKSYYGGVVKSYDGSTKRHKVLYDDGEEELIDLNQERWELVKITSKLSIISFERLSATPDSAMYGDDDGDLSGIRRELVENISSISDSVGPALPRCDINCILGYNVKQEIAPILKSIFMIHGDIAADCFFKTYSVRTSFLELICEVVKRIESSDVSTIISDMEEIERQVLEAQQANINVSWLQTRLETIRERKESMKTLTLLNTILVKRAVEADLIESCKELMTAQARFFNAERCAKVLDIVERNLKESVKQPLMG